MTNDMHEYDSKWGERKRLINCSVDSYKSEVCMYIDSIIDLAA